MSNSFLEAQILKGWLDFRECVESLYEREEERGRKREKDRNKTRDYDNVGVG